MVETTPISTPTASRQWHPWVFAIIAAAAVFAGELVLESFQKHSLRDQARVRVIGELGHIRAHLESEINGNLLAIKGLTAVIAAQPDIDQAGFARIAQGLAGERRSLRNIAGAPDMVIRLMYPIEGNEAAIGLDYRTHVGQRDAVLKAVETGGAVLAGPLTLVQGGTGLVVREPVFVAPDQAGQPRRVWGLVSAVLDVDRLYQAAGLDSAGRSGGLTLALRGTDGTGSKGNTFYGDPALFSQDPVTTTVSLPGGSWQLAALPTAGWAAFERGGNLTLIRAAGASLSVTLALMTFLLTRGHLRLRETAAELRDSRARLDALLDTIPDLIWLKDPHGAYLACNARFEAFFGASEESIIGRFDADFVDAELAAGFRRDDLAAIAAGRPRTTEETVTFVSDGHQELLETTKAPVYAAGGGLLGVVGVARDITERRKAELQLQKQRQMLADSQRIARIGSWEIDLASGVRTWSDETYRIYGVDPDTFENTMTDFFALIHPDDQPALRDWIDALIAGRAPGDLELHVVRPDGQARIINGRGILECDTDGQPRRAWGTAQDITERKQAEEQAQQGRLVLDTVFQALPDLFFLMDSDGTIRDYRAMRNDLYLPPETFLGQHMQSVLPDELGKQFAHEIAALREGEGLRTLEYTLDMHGAQRYFEARLSLLPGRPQIIAVIRDISERAEAQAMLQRQQRLLADSQRMAHIGSWEIDLDSGALAWSDETYRLHGVSADTFEPGLESILNLVIPEDRIAVKQNWQALLDHDTPVDLEFSICRPDGQERVLTGSGVRVRDAHGRPVRAVGTVQDITQRKLTERALAAKQREASFLSDLVERSSQPLAVGFSDGRLGRANRAFLDLVGYTLDELEQIDWAHDLTPEKWRQVESEALDRLTRQRTAVRYEKEYIRKDGSIVPVELYAHIVQDDPNEQPYYFAFVTDISERKRAAQAINQLNQELEQRVEQRTHELAAANRELETFTYSVSHDLKAPLRGIDGYSRLLIEDHSTQLDEEGQLFLHRVRDGVAQMSQLIEDLLAYSRMERRPLQGSAVDVRRLVESTIDSRSREIAEHGATVKVTLKPLIALADPEGLDIVFRNLIDNALKFSRDSTPPVIEITGRANNETIIVEVRDNGIGFDMRFHERIFNIFQRLQRAEDYPGTGVGLAIVRRAVERMGGRVWASSTPGKGATFVVELPR